ncbi:MAG: FAD-dependent oxidoreductase [Pseudomonadota bacterium]
MRIVIVGAGITGAALAFACACRGAEVIVVDAGQPASGATGHSFGWVNASFFLSEAHFALRAAGIEAYRRLCARIDLPVQWAGCLCWENQGPELERQFNELKALDYDVEALDRRAFEALEPHVAPPEQALRFSSEAAVAPAALTSRLLRACGARCLFGCAVLGVEVAGGKVTGVRVPGGLVAADAVVICAGTGAAQLLDPLGIALPMLSRPGVIVETDPVPPVLSHVCAAPIGEFRQTPSGQIVMPAAVSHQADTAEEITATPEHLAEAAIARLRSLLPGVPLNWRNVALAKRPVPGDGLPVLGAVGPEGLFTAVMHSGITLAPLVGELMAARITEQRMTNAQAQLMAPFSPERLQETGAGA